MLSAFRTRANERLEWAIASCESRSDANPQRLRDGLPLCAPSTPFEATLASGSDSVQAQGRAGGCIAEEHGLSEGNYGTFVD